MRWFIQIIKNLKLYGPFLWMGFNCLKATATSRRQFTFYHSVPRNYWYSFYQPRKDERLSRPWGHPVVLNKGPLDWESSALTTRPLLRKNIWFMHIINMHFKTLRKTVIVPVILLLFPCCVTYISTFPSSSKSIWLENFTLNIWYNPWKSNCWYIS